MHTHMMMQLVDDLLSTNFESVRSRIVADAGVFSIGIMLARTYEHVGDYFLQKIIDASFQGHCKRGEAASRRSSTTSK